MAAGIDTLTGGATPAAWRSAGRVVPAPLTRGSRAREFRMVAATERRRIELGLPTPQLER